MHIVIYKNERRSTVASSLSRSPRSRMGGDLQPHPPVPELAKPSEGLSILHLLLDELGHHITGMHINGAGGHDALAVAFGEFP